MISYSDQAACLAREIQRREGPSAGWQALRRHKKGSAALAVEAEAMRAALATVQYMERLETILKNLQHAAHGSTGCMTCDSIANALEEIGYAG